MVRIRIHILPQSRMSFGLVHICPYSPLVWDILEVYTEKCIVAGRLLNELQDSFPLVYSFEYFLEKGRTKNKINGPPMISYFTGQR